VTTVSDVNRAFQAKKIFIELPYPEEWLVRDIQILEKKDSPRGVKVLLAVDLIRDGKVFHDICFLEGGIEREEYRTQAEVELPRKTSHTLPVRNRFDFDSEAEVLAYLKEAFGALLLDHGYEIRETPEADLFGLLEERGFFAMLAVRSDARASEQAERLIGLRRRHRHMHDYGLVMPAFQEPLGVSMSAQESWVMAHVDLLSTHRIGVYGVDNSDPNRIYPFTVYPQVRGLLRYFVAASRQWQDVRAQYTMSRGK
jgi:hypothetical protein